MNTLKGLNLYVNYKQIIDDLIEFEKVPIDKIISNEYKKVFNEWKNLKRQVNEL